MLNTMINKGVPRRAFLRMLMGAVAVGAVGRAMSASQILLPMSPETTIGPSLKGTLSNRLFSGLIGQAFTLVNLRNPKSKYRAHLQEVVELNTVYISPETDQFYLVFQIDDSRILSSGTYRVQHATAGRTQLFLQAVNSDTSGSYCRADFNLLL